MNGVRKCPYCGSTNVEIISDGKGELFAVCFYIVCQCCKARGPEEGTKKGAAKEWNKVSKAHYEWVNGKGRQIDDKDGSGCPPDRG